MKGKIYLIRKAEELCESTFGIKNEKEQLVFEFMKADGLCIEYKYNEDGSPRSKAIDDSGFGEWSIYRYDNGEWIFDRWVEDIPNYAIKEINIHKYFEEDGTQKKEEIEIND